LIDQLNEYNRVCPNIKFGTYCGRNLRRKKELV